ncbi:MAG: ABC transporter ATP-binding protein [Actinomycetota bacterium]
MPSEGTAAFSEDLVKVYRTATSAVHALDGVTVDFPRGALAAVAGRSGSGKSTLLRLIAGLDRPTGGRLFVNDVPLHSASAVRLRHVRHRTVGYVFQRASDNFFPHLTIGEHLRVATREAGLPQFDPAQLLDVLGIADRVGHLPAELSGGEQARAAVAQVLARGAGIVVADEPTAELDTASADGVLRAIRELVELGVTFILATHDPAVMRRAGAMVELEHGKLRPKTRDRGDPALSAAALGHRLRDELDPPADVAAGPPVLEAHSVRKSFKRGDEMVVAVEGADLVVEPGQLVGLIGRSGSGKTTLLNIAAGWERPDEGSLSVLGEDPGRSVPQWSDVSVLPQKLGLIEELTVRENIEYPARLTGTLASVGWIVDRLITSLGLHELADRYPNETSVGEQQRTAVARALVLSPRLILVDEPTGHQDRAWGDAVFGAIRDAVARGTSCLAATHDEQILRHVDRVLTMSDGHLSERAP